MPAAYSYDLRKKAMEILDEGESREAVAARFKIGQLYMSGKKDVKKQEILYQKSPEVWAIIIKSPTGMLLLNS